MEASLEEVVSGWEGNDDDLGTVMFCLTRDSAFGYRFLCVGFPDSSGAKRGKSVDVNASQLKNWILVQG